MASKAKMAANKRARGDKETPSRMKRLRQRNYRKEQSNE